jgi:hypothetical protein
MRIIDLKTSAYFSGMIMIAGAALVLMAVIVFFVKLWLALFLFVSGIVIFTTHYRLRVDLDKRVFFDYVWILGMKSGERGTFDHIEYIFIKKSNVTQTMNHRAGSNVLRKEVYDSYLKFSDANKIHLASRDSKRDLVKQLQSLAMQLNVRIIDYSEGQPHEIHIV